MAISKITLSGGRVRYIARLYRTEAKNSRTKRFDTWEEAHNQIRDWRDIDAKREAKKWPSDCSEQQHNFLYGVRK
jgi:hypothetical protein